MPRQAGDDGSTESILKVNVMSSPSTIAHDKLK